MVVRRATACWMLLFAATAYANVCGPSGCWPASTPDVAMARVSHADGRGASSGTATLVVHAGGRSYFLTCAHVFADAGQTTIAMPAEHPIAGRLVAIDRQHDLAIVETRRIDMQPVAVDAVPEGELTACGFGPSGQRRCVRGPLVGYATPQGAAWPSLRMRGAVRPGDSGGPVLNAAGRLVGVVWGARGGETYASFGRPLQKILGRLPTGESESSATARLRRPVEGTPPPSRADEIDKRFRTLDGRLASLEDRLSAGFGAVQQRMRELASRGEVRAIGEATGAELGGGRERLERLARVVGAVGGAVGGAAGRPLVAPELATLVGVLGPAAAGVLVGRYWWRKRRRRRRAASRNPGGRPIAVDTPPPPQRAVPQTHFVPYATDDFAKAHQWAGEQLARKFPGSVEWLASLDSLIKQQLAGRREE